VPDESRARPCRNAPRPRIVKKGSEKAATELPKTEPRLFRRRPMIPQRFAARRRDAVPVRGPAEKLIAGVETPPPLPSVMRQRPWVKMAETSLLDEPVKEWADTLMKDIDLVSRTPETRGGYASTPITTTTGFDLSLLNRAFAGLDGPPDTRGGQAIPTLTELAHAFDLPDPSAKANIASSQPRTARKRSPNDDRPRATPTTGISSVRQLTPTKLRTERLSPKACPRGPAEQGISHTSTSTSRGGRDDGAREASGSSGEEMAVEAAQAAMARARPADTTQGDPPPGGSRPSTPLLPGQNAEDGTGGRSRAAAVDASEQEPRHTTFATRGLAGTVMLLLLRATWAYWVLVRPCFDGTSPMRRRLEAGRSTWGDVVVAALTAVFVVVVMAAGVWTYHGVVLVSDILRAVVKGVAVFIGL